jgi:hypothetical protein
MAAAALAGTGASWRASAQTATASEAAREENAYVLGVLAYLWGFPLRFYELTDGEGLRTGAVGINTYHRYATLKTARDRFVVTPNNVTIDAYASYDVRQEPLVVVAPVLARPRWYIVQIGDSLGEIVQNLGGYSRATARDLPDDRPGFPRRHTGRNGPHRQPHLTRTPRHADLRQWRGRSFCCLGAEGLSRHSAECLFAGRAYHAPTSGNCASRIY